MRRTLGSGAKSAVLALACALTVAGAGCGPSEMVDTDSGPRDAGRDSGMPPTDARVDSSTDPCASVPDRCDTAGVSCEADELVTCAANAMGCLVETRQDCGATAGGSCGSPMGTAMCVVDPCEAISAADRCTTAGDRACTGETLEVCTMNAMGCLVLERTECDAVDGGACDDSDPAMEVCAIPADPCADIPMADRCDTAGTSCDTDTLVTCAPNAFGCLVTTRSDCTARTGGTCGGTPATCTATDPCAGITQCTALGTSCDGPSLVTCAPDAFGCNVETRTDCTDAPFGFCDADGAPASCETAATDPCMGVTQCDPMAVDARSCTDDTLTACEANAFGCYVTETTDCDATMDVCDATSGTAACVDPCTLIPTCAAPLVCDGNDIVTCAPDAMGCLVPTMRSTCPLGPCDASGAMATCSDAVCPEASPIVLDCATSTIMDDTAMGSDARNTYPGCGNSFNYPGRERIYRFRTDTTAAVRIVSTRGSSTQDYDLYVLAPTSPTASCTSTSTSDYTCADSSTGTGATETIDFVARPGETYFIAYDVFNADAATTTFDLAVTCVVPTCGDAMLTGFETCEDGNTTSGDGCSATCEAERGYVCTGTPSVCTFQCGNGMVQTGVGESCDDGNTTASDGCSATCATEPGFNCIGAPSTCFAQSPNATCAGALELTAAGRTGDDLRTGGARPTGTNCGSSAGSVLFYTVTIPANTVATVTGTPTGATPWDLTLRSLVDCAAGACLANVDSGGNGAADSIRVFNTTSAPVTRVIAVGADSATTFGTFDLALTTAALAPNAGCGGAIDLGSTGIRTGETITNGASGPVGTGCGSVPGNTLYYSVTVPALSIGTVRVTAVTGFNASVRTLADCAATTCIGTTDAASTGGNETVTINNSSTSAITRIVAVSAVGTGGAGTFDIAVSTAALPYTPIAPACADMTGATALVFTDDDDDSSDIAALPFTFTYFGTAMTHYSADTNGYAQLFPAAAGVTTSDFSNDPIPSMSVPNGHIAALWDDLGIADAGQGVSVLTTGTAPNRVFVIEWNADFRDSSTLRFQAQLYETTNVVEVHYCTLMGTSSAVTGTGATVGIEAPDGMSGRQVGHNTAGTLSTTTAYRFTP